jgi:three-Cys-motif partner protein
MVEKPYLWKAGAKLEEHSKRKHRILREYLARYLIVRCQLPQQARFRLAIVEGFAGGGRYASGEAGSPIIFIEELRNATERFNLKRAAEGMAPLDIECLMALNDESPEAIDLLRAHIEPMLAATKVEFPKLHLHVEYLND